MSSANPKKNSIQDTGKVLRKIRAMLSLSQEEMAKELNVSIHTYRNWEYGTSPPSHLPLALKWSALQIMLSCDHRECAVLAIKNILHEVGWDALSISYFAELLSKACISDPNEISSNNNIDLVRKIDQLWDIEQ